MSLSGLRIDQIPDPKSACHGQAAVLPARRLGFKAAVRLPPRQLRHRHADRGATGLHGFLGGAPVSHDQLDLLALCRVKGVDWNLLAREAQRPGGLGRLLAGEVTEDTPAARENAALLVAAKGELDRHR